MTDTIIASDATASALSHAPISHAYVRKPGEGFGLDAYSIGIADLARAAYQHDAYCRALIACGVEVRALRHDPQFPDGCFINDVAVVTPSLAVIANFGERHARQGEQQAAASVLAGSRIIKCITAPGTLDASDVAQIGDHFVIGLSARTNQEGAAQLAYFLGEFGYRASVISTEDQSLRLGRAVCDLGPDARGAHRILLREDLARHYAFLPYAKTIVVQEDREALDSLMVNGTLLMPYGYGDVARSVAALGIAVEEVNVSEFARVGAGLRSLSLRLPARPTQDSVIRLTDIRQKRAA